MAIEMVDTNVLIYAMRRPRKEDGNDLKAMLTASHALVAGLAEIRMSAVAKLEVMRGLRPAERAQSELVKVLDRVVVDAVDQAVTERALFLLSKRNEEESTCSRCLGSAKDAACSKCGKHTSAQQRLNDAIIAATADVLAERDPQCALYAYDSGVLAFAAHVHHCKIVRPPNPSGPLFEREHERTVAGPHDAATVPATRPPGSTP